MRYHIVRNNETINEILTLYDINIDELKENNKHIKSWNRLYAGTKLIIPAITESDDTEILEMEPFIEDYYPSIESVFAEEDPIVRKDQHMLEIKEKQEEKPKNNEKIEENLDEVEYEEPIYGYNPYFIYPFIPYYVNPYYRR